MSFSPQRVPWKSFRLLHWRRINGASAQREASQHHYAKETPTSSFVFVLNHVLRRGAHTHKTEGSLKKAPSPSCEDKSLWWTESGDTVQFSKWVTPLFTIIRPNVLHQGPKTFFLFFSPLHGLWFVVRDKNHLSGTALSAVCSFFIRLSVIIHFWVTVLHVGSNERKLIFFADSHQSKIIFTLALFFIGSQLKTSMTPNRTVVGRDCLTCISVCLMMEIKQDWGRNNVFIRISWGFDCHLYMRCPTVET